MSYSPKAPQCALNVVPVEVDLDAVLRIGIEPYDDERLRTLRDNHRGIYFFQRFREVDGIVCVSLDEAYDPIGADVIERRLGDVAWLVPPLVLDALLRYFHANNRPVLGYKPLRIVTKQASDELLRKSPLKGDQIPKWLERRVAYAFDTRTIYPDRKTARVALACDVRVANIIGASVADLLAINVPIIGHYVQRREQTSDPRLWPKLRLVGRVRDIEGSTLCLDDQDGGVSTLDASEAYLEPKQDRVNACLRVLFPDYADQIIARADRAAAALRDGREQLRRTEAMLGILGKQKFEISPGVPFTLGALLRQGKAGAWFPVSTDIAKPGLVFDPSGSRVETWGQGGLDKHGPYDRRTFSPKTPKVLVICQASVQGQVEEWLQKFLDGMPDTQTGSTDRKSTPYEKGFTRRYHLQDVRTSTFTTLTPDAKAYVGACRHGIEAAAAKGGKWDLALVQIDEEFRQLHGNENPYLATKAFLLKLGVPVQEVTLETMTLPATQLAYAMNNISLAVYAKLGGTPWLLKSQPTVARELIIGLGSHEVQESRFGANERVMGITTVFSADGSYLLDNTTTVVPYAEYAEAMLDSVTKAVRTVSQEQNWKASDTVRLVFHAIKPFRDDEVATVARVVGELGHSDTEFAFVQFSESHAFRLFDEAQMGVSAKGGGKKGIFAPPRGRALYLSEHEALLSLVGANEVKKPSDGTPQPALIRVHRLSTFTDLHTLARQAFDFSCHSWKSFFPARLPITIVYSEFIATMIRSFRDIDTWDEDAMLLSPVARKPWFL